SRKSAGVDGHAITSPLVTTAAGTKFGKTESGTIWLDSTLTTPYKFYQFLVNVDDRDAGKYLRYFTLLEREAVEALDDALAAQPEKREAQQALARGGTNLVHGERALAGAQDVSCLLCGSVDPQPVSPHPR